MKKVLKPKDILLFTLAAVGDFIDSAKDPLCLVSSAYQQMYGFVPRNYKKHNFAQMVSRAIKAGDIEKIVKKGKVYVRLTTQGKKQVSREFPALSLLRHWNGKWVIVIFDIEERSRIHRDQLRGKLRELGFGMLQKSIWLTPLPIGKEMNEFISSRGLSRYAYVMEVAELLALDPKELARKVWRLDRIEEECLALHEAIEDVHRNIAILHDRIKKRDLERQEETHMQKDLMRLEMEKVRLQRKWLLLLSRFPLLPEELLPDSLRGWRGSEMPCRSGRT